MSGIGSNLFISEIPNTSSKPARSAYCSLKSRNWLLDKMSMILAKPKVHLEIRHNQIDTQIITFVDFLVNLLFFGFKLQAC